MARSGSDKSGNWHNYTEVYHSLFKTKVDDVLNVFELGLGTNNPNVPSNMGIHGVPGASVRGWRDYFPKASIFGADIDRNILFTEDRITTMYCDQRNPAVIHNMWSSLPDMDIIIEDGLHQYDANVTFFENSIHKLKAGGIFVIEDIVNADIPRFIRKFEEWREKFPGLTFETRMLRHPVNSHDNNLAIVRSY